MKFEHYYICSECAAENGGTWPDGHCCTVTEGKCKYCGEEGTIIPWVDFDWPKDKEIDAIAKRRRD